MPTLAQMLRTQEQTTRRAPRPNGVDATRARNAQSVAAMRARTAESQRPMPIVATPSPAKVEASAKAIAHELLQDTAFRKRLREAGIALPPVDAPAVARTPNVATLTFFTPQEALASLQASARAIRHTEDVAQTTAFARACDARPDLAAAAGMAGAGTESLDAWTNGRGAGHLPSCQCGLTGCHPGA